MANNLQMFNLGGWQGATSVFPEIYICGYCNDKVSSGTGYYAQSPSSQTSVIRICPSCNGPTFFTAEGKRYPSDAPGERVPNVPEGLDKLYNEARVSAGAGAYTGAVLICRKMLMNIAATEGAGDGKTFKQYVDYLADNNFIPPHGKGWVDYIRLRGNEATHEIQLMEEKDAKALITFVEMLLRFIYEFPNMVPVAPTTP